MRHWLHRHFLDPFITLLRQGMTPDRLALSVAIGMVVGNIPILGVSSILCGIIALVLRLNVPAIQLVQAAMAPTQILLIIPYVRLGEWLLRASHQPLSIKAGLALIAHGARNAILVLWDAIVHAGIAWMLTAPFAILLLYRILTRVFARATSKLEADAAAHGSRAPTISFR